MGKCTIPRILGFGDWFDARFADLCEEHDLAYLTRIWKLKTDSDYVIAATIIARGVTENGVDKRYFWLGIGTFVYCVTLGTLYWVWKK